MKEVEADMKARGFGVKLKRVEHPTHGTILVPKGSKKEVEEYKNILKRRKKIDEKKESIDKYEKKPFGGLVVSPLKSGYNVLRKKPANIGVGLMKEVARGHDVRVARARQEGAIHRTGMMSAGIKVPSYGSLKRLTRAEKSKGRAKSRGAGRPRGTYKARYDPLSGNVVSMPAQQFYRRKKIAKSRTRQMANKAQFNERRRLARKGIPPQLSTQIIDYRHKQLKKMVKPLPKINTSIGPGVPVIQPVDRASAQQPRPVQRAPVGRVLTPQQQKIIELNRRGFTVLPNGKVVRTTGYVPQEMQGQPQKKPGTWQMLKDIFGNKKKAPVANQRRQMMPAYQPQQQQQEPEYQQQQYQQEYQPEYGEYNEENN